MTYRTTALATLMAAGLGTAAQAEVEIEYWQYFFDARVEAMEQLIENFEAANPDITVTMTHFPYADYRTKVAAAIPAGEGPDVVQLFYGWLNDYVEADLIQPLPADVFPAEKIDAEFFPMVQAMKDGDAYWALPTAVRSLALFYNERLFEEAGIEAPPETLDEMMDIAAKLTKRDGAGNLTQVGITAGMTAQDHHWWREGLIRQMGGEPYLDDYQTVNYNSDAGRAALDMYTSMFTGDDAVTAIGFMDEPQAAFKAGRAGMHIDGSFRIGSLNGTRGLKWGVTELPATADGTRSNYSSYWVNAITTKAEGEKYDAAVKFMEYITSDEAMQIWLDVVGELPAKPSVGLTEENANDATFGPFIRGLAYANTTKFANESAQRQLMVEMVERITLQDMDPAESLAIAAEAEQKILDEYYAD
ncbi:extracellular solute-binding protein [Jannaschia seohaensis]|uniref:Multiple sugar transport system substrate-binding protein n=1 Tax=Jannaschia seohaensis TaxID=475081 RepID=A0A2Y9B4T6_9RHOB|nr:extracellular solute-binding protein [Jannaschia seohaensis]PWJ11447.1 multiple sugar transport system substrate-binding protein [Jannaschia seohaensis]SSA51421.1 multiple sugar transport system substrate-binding protein [Jannaschia seohaensis]